jgi:hypothetical protein
MEDFLTRPREESTVIEPTRPRLTSFGEATYWHDNPDVARLAQKMREQLGQPTVVRTLGTPNRLTCR